MPETLALSLVSAPLPENRALLAHFDQALQHTRRPGLRFSRVGLRVWRQPDGTIFFSRDHRDRMQRRRLARLLPNGELVGPFENTTSRLTAEQTELVRRLCADPRAAIAAEGRATGSCCICRRTLTDPESVALGIGPICAGNWGLIDRPATARPSRNAQTIRRARSLSWPVSSFRAVAVAPQGEVYNENDW